MTYSYQDYWRRAHRNESALSAVGYSALGEGFNRVAYGQRRRALLRLLKRLSFPAGRVCLEGACGNGAYASVWRRLGIDRWIGIDLSPEAITALRHRFPRNEFVVLDLTSHDWGNLERDP